VHHFIDFFLVFISFFIPCKFSRIFSVCFFIMPKNIKFLLQITILKFKPFHHFLCLFFVFLKFLNFSLEPFGMCLTFLNSCFWMVYFCQFYWGILILFFHFPFNFTSLYIQSTLKDPLKCFPFLCNQLSVVSIHQKELFIFFKKHTCSLHSGKLRIAGN